MPSSITELSNELSDNIDIASAFEIVKILRSCDGQLFSGYKGFDSIYDVRSLETVELVVSKCKTVIQSTEGKIILSGAGTSGRLGFFLAREFNRVLNSSGHRSVFEYLIAGKDQALVKAQENTEDDGMIAIQDLRNCIGEGQGPFTLISITCGMSAPYCAAQLDYSLSDSRFNASVLVGFSPIECSRNIIIEKWYNESRVSFLDVANRIANSSKGIILNPVVGPEAITGSTRMKSGSVTKFLLECCFVLSLPSTSNTAPVSLLETLSKYETTYRETYINAKDISIIVEEAGESLRKGGHIYYIAEDPTFGILGFIDASEQQPTYGASPFDVRCFIKGGWNALLNREGDLSKYGDIFIFDWTSINNYSLSSNDLIIFLHLNNSQISDESLNLMQNVKLKGVSTALVSIGLSRLCISDSVKAIFNKFVNIALSNILLCPNLPCLAEISLKWILNAITTGAHVLKGKVFKNSMIDVSVSNNKLFYRAANIISKITSKDVKLCEELIIKSIWETDSITKELLDLPTSQHIQKAFSRPNPKIVPIAILMAFNKSYEQAKETINKEPIIRKVIAEYIQ